MLTTLSFLIGAFFSGMAGYVGMWVSVRANVRVAAGARRSAREALQISMRAGGFAAMVVVGMVCVPLCHVYTELHRIPCGYLQRGVLCVFANALAKYLVKGHWPFPHHVWFARLPNLGYCQFPHYALQLSSISVASDTLKPKAMVFQPGHTYDPSDGVHVCHCGAALWCTVAMHFFEAVNSELCECAGVCLELWHALRNSMHSG